MCSLGESYRKANFQQCFIAHDSAYIILINLPMVCSASHMFGTADVNSYN